MDRGDNGHGALRGDEVCDSDVSSCRWCACALSSSRGTAREL